jgi:hypothetical protein
VPKYQRAVIVALLLVKSGRRLDTSGWQCHIHAMTNRDPTNLTLEEIESDLEISEAQAARGETVPLSRVLERLDAAIARMEARHRNSPREAMRAR